MRAFAILPALASLFAAVPAFGQTTSTLDCGVIASGSFSQGPVDFFNFTALPGDSILIRAVSTSADPAFAPKFSLFDPANRMVNPRTTVATTSPTVVGEFDLPGGGPYQIRAQNPLSAPPGTYKLAYTFLNRPCTQALLTCGTGVAGQLSAQLQMNTYQFSATAGDILSLRVTKYAPFTAGSGVALFVFSPAGQLLSTANSQPAAAGVGPSGSARVDFPAPATGVLNLVVFDRSAVASIDNYAFSITRLNGPCGSNVLSCGAVEHGRIGTPLGMESYSLPLAAGEVAAVRTAVLAAGTIAPLIEIYDSNGVFLSSVPSNVQGSPVISFTLTARTAGTYTVFVRDGSTGSATGGYAITLVRLTRPCGATVIACGSVVDGSVAGLMANNVYTLTASAGDLFLLRVLRTDPNASFRPRIDIYDVQARPIQSLTVSETGRLSFTTTADGLYRIIVADSLDNTPTGAYALSLQRLNRPCNTAPLSCGALASGSLSRPLASAAYTYNAAPGESFTVRMIDPSGALQPVIEVYDPTGVSAGLNISGSFTGVDVAQPAGGTYTILATDGARRPAGGPYSIELLRTVNPCGISPPQGETRNGLITGPAPYTVYSLPAATGDSLLIRSASFTPGFSAQMEIYDPSGRRLDSQTFRIARTAAVDGNYTVILGASGPRTGGAFSFAWQLLNRPAGTVPLACGATTTASLSATNEFRYYSARANAGDLMRLLFTRTSDNFSPQIELFDPAGSRLAASPDISQRAADDGSYLVVVSPAGSAGETGSFAVSYQRPNDPCDPVALTCGQITLRQVNVPGQLDTFSFSGTGGDRANLRFSQRTGNYAAFAELYDASGARVASSSSGSLVAALPTTGAYAVLVRDRSATSLGSYRVSLQDDTAVCTANDREAPVLTLVQPTGGEVIAGASSFQIAWQSDDNVAVSAHEVAISTDSGKTFPAPIAVNLGGNVQSYTWAVPADIAPSRTAVIRVTASDAAGNTQTALSGTVSIIGSGFTPNRTATYTYDALNRIIQAVLNDGRTIQYTWDAAGNLVQVVIATP